MRLAFTKMHGLGNDFLVIDNLSGRYPLAGEQARWLADRHLGVGCDQVLVVESPASRPGGEGEGEGEFRLRIYNADGSEAEQCGNGVRCVAAFLRRAGHAGRDELNLSTAAGVVRCRVDYESQPHGPGPDSRGSPGWVSADMGVPRLEPGEIPFVAEARAPSYPLQLGGDRVRIAAVSMGNPHAVMEVEDVARAPLESLGPQIQSHPRFPHGANVGFMEVQDRGHIRLRVLERGAGETLACGSGACAAVVAGREQGLLEAEVVVELLGGRLQVAWPGPGESVWMGGPTAWVFEGTTEL